MITRVSEDDMRVALNFITKSIKEDLLYRFDFVGSLAILIIFFLTRLFFLDALYGYGEDLSGWSQPEITFLLFTLIWILVLSDTFDNSVLHYFQKLYHGEADTFFLKPTSLLNYIFLAWVKVSNLYVFPIV